MGGRSLLGMVLAALIVSILALIVSTAAVLYNRQQARAARELAAPTDTALRLDRSRRHDERMPHISPRIWQPADSGDDYQLDLLLDHKTPSGQLAEVDVVLTQFTDRDDNTYPADEMYLLGGRPGISFARGQQGVHALDGFDPLHTARWEAKDGKPRPLRPGEKAEWRVQMYEHPLRPTQVHMDVTCRSTDGEEWIVTLSVDVPPNVSVTAR